MLDSVRYIGIGIVGVLGTWPRFSISVRGVFVLCTSGSCYGWCSCRPLPIGSAGETTSDAKFLPRV